MANQPGAESVFCGNCGTQNPASQRFCTNCGAALSAPANTQGAQVYQAPPSNQVAPVTQPKKRGGFLRGCLIAVGALILLGILASLFGGRNNTSDTTARRTASQAPVAVASQAASEAPAASQVASEAPAASEAASTAPAAKESYAVGETATLNGLNVTVNEVKQVEGNQVFKPESGKRFVVINATFENTTDKDIPISSLLQMELKDDTGQAYNLDLGATSIAGGKQPDGNIAPRDKVRGPIGYQVPMDAKGLQWIFKEAIGSGRVVFAVNP